MATKRATRAKAARPPAAPAFIFRGLVLELGQNNLEAIPADWQSWHVNAANAATLAATLHRDRDLAFLFRDLATLRTDIPLFASVDELRWAGPTPAFAAFGERFDRAAQTRGGNGSF